MKRKPKGLWFVGFTPDFWASPALTLAEKGLLGVLARWCDETMHCDPTIEQICAEAGACRQTVVSLLQSLRAKGALDWTRFRYKGRNRKLYRVIASNILTVGWVGATVNVFNSSPHKMYVREMPPQIPTKAKWKSAWNMVLFPTEAMSKPHSELAEQNLKNRPDSA